MLLQNQKCHAKSMADFQFLGDSSSLLVSAGHSGQAGNDANLALWDCLLPPSKACVQSELVPFLFQSISTYMLP